MLKILSLLFFFIANINYNCLYAANNINLKITEQLDFNIPIKDLDLDKFYFDEYAMIDSNSKYDYRQNKYASFYNGIYGIMGSSKHNKHLEKRKIKRNKRLRGRFYGKRLCHSEEYFCIKIKRGDTWEKLFPNAKNRDIVKRLNRTNLRVSRRRWILVPRVFSYDVRDHSPLPMHLNTNNKKLIYIDLSDQAFGAYDKNGNLVHWGPIASGTRGRPTVRGKFAIYSKRGPGCVSYKYYHTPMPYCMFFYRGFAIHGQVLPGYPASKGCVRILTKDARWLHNTFAPIGTKVQVIS